MLVQAWAQKILYIPLIYTIARIGELHVPNVLLAPGLCWMSAGGEFPGLNQSNRQLSYPPNPYNCKWFTAAAGGKMSFIVSVLSFWQRVGSRWEGSFYFRSSYSSSSYNVFCVLKTYISIHAVSFPNSLPPAEKAKLPPSQEAMFCVCTCAIVKEHYVPLNKGRNVLCLKSAKKVHYFPLNKECNVPSSLKDQGHYCPYPTSQAVRK